MARKSLVSIFTFVLFITAACTQNQIQKHHHDPTKQPLRASDINQLKVIHVAVPQIRGCAADMYLHKKNVAGSAAKGALQGTAAGFVAVPYSLIYAPDPILVLISPVMIPTAAVVGTFMGASAARKTPVTPTDDQLMTIQGAFMHAIEAAEHNARVLQDYFVSEGNLRTTIRFVPEEERSNSAVEIVNMPDSASLFSTVETITLTGRATTNPDMTIKIGLRFFIKSDGEPANCLGWYESVWEGGTYRLSGWLARDGEYIRKELVSAYKSEYQNAMNLLFDPTSRDSHPRQSPEIQTWTNCVIAQTQMILDHAAWYCAQADQGIADPQRRIGDLFNYGGGDITNRDVIRAYVWYSLAAKGNNTEAALRLIELENELTPGELEEANARVDDWVPGLSGQCKKDLIESGLIR